MTWAHRLLTNQELEMISKYENRTKAAYPSSISYWSSPKSFMKHFSLFFDDHLALRDDLLTFNSLIHYFAFDSSSSKVVALGENKWIFLNSSQIKTAYSPPDKQFEQASKIWKNVVIRKTELQKSRGGQYALVIVPNKHSIYPELLPPRLRKIVSSTRIDTIVNQFEDTDLNVLDLKPVLLRSKDRGQLFYRTDTHWTELGVKLAVEHLRQSFETVLHPTNLMEKIAPNTQKRLSGDLAQILGIADWIDESVDTFKPHKPCHNVASQQALVFQGDTTLNINRYQCNNGDATVLLFADSFGIAFAPELATHVGTLYTAKQRPSYFEYNLLVEKYQPDLVVELYVERTMHVTSTRGMPLVEK